jgi:hypothetical protein
MAETPFYGPQFPSVLDGHVGSSCGLVLGVGAQVHLGSVFGFEPPGTHLLQAFVDLDRRIAENVDEEARLGLQTIRRYAQVDMMKTRHENQAYNVPMRLERALGVSELVSGFRRAQASLAVVT